MRRFLLSLVLAVAVAGPGITWIGPAEAADATVTLTDRANPATLTVAPGTRVTFANQSGDRKRIRSEDGPADFDSGNLEAGESWSVVLDAAGTYPYVDERDRDDPAYHGTITVSSTAAPGGGSPNPPAPGGSPPAGSPAPPAPSTASVAILDRSFSPATVTVAPGGTVSWANQSDRDHTVTGTGFDSGILGGGGRFSHTFPSAGTFTYICELHSEMRASVTVAAAPPPGVECAIPRPVPRAPSAPQPQASQCCIRPDHLRPSSIVWTNQPGRALRHRVPQQPSCVAFACTIEMTGVSSRRGTTRAASSLRHGDSPGGLSCEPDLGEPACRAGGSRRRKRPRCRSSISPSSPPPFASPPAARSRGGTTASRPTP